MRLCLPALPPSRAPATPETWSSVSNTSAWSRPLVLCRNASPTPRKTATSEEFTVSEERTLVRKCPCMVTFDCSSNRRTRQLHAPACRELTVLRIVEPVSSTHPLVGSLRMSVDKRISSKLAPVAAMPSVPQARTGPQVAWARGTGTPNPPTHRNLLGTPAAECRYPGLGFGLPYAGFL